jgi:glycosyltransferase involved in cell wall biosynthesis
MLRCGISAAIITVVPNGIDASDYSNPVDKEKTREQLGIPSGSIVAGTLSSLSSEKGLDFALKAMAKAKMGATNLHLLIVGDGPESENLQSLTKLLGLGESVTFTGRRSDVNTLLSAMDIFLLPSLNEGLPMALLEAMAAQKAVIASAVGDVATVVSAESGILIESANVEQLSTAILSLANDKLAVENYGRNAKKRIEDHFSSLAMARTTASIYNDVLNH